MEYTCEYTSPLGTMLLSSDEVGITGVWFVGQRYFARTLGESTEAPEHPVLRQACRWLDAYFQHDTSVALPPLHPRGTEFQRLVWQYLLQIPMGQTSTYGRLGELVAKQLGRTHMSAQAIGSAVGHNPISILIPCHRVVGADGSLTGYAGGLERKEALLNLEKITASRHPSR